MIANTTPPPSGSGTKLKEYKFQYQSAGFQSDASNPNLYYYAKENGGGSAEGVLEPGGYIYNMGNRYAQVVCHIGESRDGDILFVWRPTFATPNSATFLTLDENGKLVGYAYQSTPYTFYAPQ